MAIAIHFYYCGDGKTDVKLDITTESKMTIFATYLLKIMDILMDMNIFQLSSSYDILTI